MIIVPDLPARTGWSRILNDSPNPVMKEYTDGKNWTAGFYHSKKDRSIFVPSRRFPLSFCPNLGRPIASLSLSLLMILTVAATWQYGPRLTSSLVDPGARGTLIVAELALFWVYCELLWKKQ